MDFLEENEMRQANFKRCTLDIKFSHLTIDIAIAHDVIEKKN